MIFIMFVKNLIHSVLLLFAQCFTLICPQTFTLFHQTNWSQQTSASVFVFAYCHVHCDSGGSSDDSSRSGDCVAAGSEEVTVVGTVTVVVAAAVIVAIVMKVAVAVMVAVIVTVMVAIVVAMIMLVIVLVVVVLAVVFAMVVYRQWK